MKSASPCLGCERRVLHCHSCCADYRSFKEQRQEISVKIRLEKAVLGYHLWSDRRDDFYSKLK